MRLCDLSKFPHPNIYIYRQRYPNRGENMGVVKILDLVGESPTSWEEAVRNAVAEAGKTVRGITRVGVKELDVRVKGDEIVAYRARVELSFRIER